MARLDIEGDELVLRLNWWEKLGAMHGDVRVPRAAIRSVDIAAQPFQKVQGVRAPGLGVPRRRLLGTWRRRGGKKDFLVISPRAMAVVVQLDDSLARYSRLVVSVRDPGPTAARLQSS